MQPNKLYYVAVSFLGVCDTPSQYRPFAHSWKDKFQGEGVGFCIWLNRILRHTHTRKLCEYSYTKLKMQIKLIVHLERHGRNKS